MEWNEIGNLVLRLIVTVIVGVVAVYVKPWVNAKVIELRQKAAEAGWISTLETIAKFVEAAEQIAENEGYDGKWKKNYVVDLVEEYLGIEVDDETDAYIEALVNELFGD